MEIKTKFNIGDQCYYMKNNKVEIDEVCEIAINIYQDGISSMIIDVRYIISDGSVFVDSENTLFKDRTSLLKTL